MALNPVANSARERFGAALKQVRLDATPEGGGTIMQSHVARALGHKTYHRYSRIERGETWPKDSEWKTICKVLLMDDVTRVRLETMRSEGLAIVESAWWNEFADDMDPSLIQFVTHEQIANKLITCSAILPGLFQTRDYARTLTRYLGKSTMTAHALERSVELRRNRRRLFDRTNPPAVEAIIGEAALRSRVGGTETMVAQLDSLIDDIATHNVVVRVIPFDANAALPYPFHLLEFGEGEKPIAAFDAMTGMVFRDQPKEVRGLKDFIGDLQDLSLSADESRERIEKIRKEMSSD